MSNQILVVPDVHGRDFWKAVLDSELPIVFLGDYIDPYGWEGISTHQALDNFKEIIVFAKQNPDRVTLLLGNHDLHYMGLSDDRCRFDRRNSEEIRNLFSDNKELFQFSFKWDNVLFTHAGVVNGWLKQNQLPDDVDKVHEFLNRDWEISKTYHYDTRGDIGFSRGGWCPNGSPCWADVSEHLEDNTFSNSIQIFGHTQLENACTMVHFNNWYCCDSRCVFIWDGENLKVY